MSPPKLLVIMPAKTSGGVESHALTLCQAAARKQWSVEAAFPKLPTTQQLIQDFSQAGISYQTLQINETQVLPTPNLLSWLTAVPDKVQCWLEKPVHLYRVLTHLYRWCRSVRQTGSAGVVMVNLPWADHAFTTLLACALFNQKSAVFFHLIPWRLNLPVWKRFLYRWMQRRQQTWIGISENNCQLISESFSIPRSKIKRIYNGVELSGQTVNPIVNKNNRAALCHELGIPKDSLLLLTVARLDTHQKGYDYLIPILPRLLNQHPHLHCIWVGNGKDKGTLLDQLAAYGVSDAVSLLGYRKDVPDLMRLADLFVFPTYFEGFPFALLEAMACGLPVVATAVNGIPEIVEHGVSGLLTAKGDSEDLFAALQWAIAHPTEMNKMANQAAQSVQAFTQEKMINESLSLLQQIASEQMTSEQMTSEQMISEQMAEQKTVSALEQPNL